MFNEYKIECKFFERKSTPRNYQNGSFIACMPEIIDYCNYPSEYSKLKFCTEKNTFCPYHQVNNK